MRTRPSRLRELLILVGFYLFASSMFELHDFLYGGRAAKEFVDAVTLLLCAATCPVLLIGRRPRGPQP